MAGTKEIKRRIKSVRNTKKITKAMELVAASKMKRAVNSTLASRMYAMYSWEILTSIAKNIESSKNPLFGYKGEDTTLETSDTSKENILLILISSNRGLCGAYNAQVIKRAINLLKSQVGNRVDIVSIGRKGDTAMRRLDQNILASFTNLPDSITLRDVLPISQLALDEYLSGRYSKVVVAYTDFISALSQKSSIKQILPISKVELKELIEDLNPVSMDSTSADKYTGEKTEKTDYLFEGDQEDLLNTLATKLVRMQIYQMLLESNASEQSARMVAMKNASEASGEMINDLTLMFNKARQANITREISEISAGMASIT